MVKISDDQIEAIKSEFKKFDTNNDNKLSKKEYYIMLRTDGTNLNEKHIKSFVSIQLKINKKNMFFSSFILYQFFALQPDVKGAINFDDLVSLLTDVNKGNTDKLKTELKKNLFKHYDRNHDGSITLKGM